MMMPKKIPIHAPFMMILQSSEHLSFAAGFFSTVKFLSSYLP